MSKIIVTVSGWCEADPEKVRFNLSQEMAKSISLVLNG